MANVAALQKIMNALLEAGYLSDEQYAQVTRESEESGQPADALLLQHHFIDEEQLAKAKATVYGLPYVDLQSREIVSKTLNVLSKEIAENTHAVSFEKEEDTVSIGMVHPRDSVALQTLDFLAQSQGFKMKYHIVSEASFKNAVKKYAQIGKEVEGALEIAKEKFVPAAPEKEVDDRKIEEVIKGAPVSRIISVILRHAVDGGASDIHIEPFGDETRIRYRVDGVLRTSLTLPKYIHQSLVSRVKVMANLKLDETRIPQDGRIRETFGKKVIDFRVSTLPLQGNEKVVMRILDTSRGVPKLEELGFRKQYVDIINEEIKKPHGMFLITGPTGSGKSTTLLTVLNLRNDESVNISTLEDPVEYNMKGVNQSQIRPEVGFTFAAGLRALLRQDPNIIMVGEIRDQETGELAIHAALTGHLIFSTLHTNDAFGVVPRMTDMHLEPFLLGATMNLVIAQRLARKICERCKAPVELSPDMMQKVTARLKGIPDSYKADLGLENGGLTLYKGMGCVRCGDTGYIGRVAVAEIMRFDDEMRKLVVEGFPIDKVREAAAHQKMITIAQDGLLKALEGFTTMEEVMRITID